MAQDILKSTTTFAIVFQLVSSSDHIAGLTGKAGSVVVQISKNGGAGATPSGAISEVDATNLPGVYKLAGNATDSGTAGPLWIYAKDAASDPYCALAANVIDPAVANYGVNVVNWLGTVVATPATAGIPDVNAKNINNATAVNGLTAAVIASAIWQDITAGDFTTASSIGKSIMNGVALGTGLTINAYTGDTPQTGDSYARIGAAGASLTSVGVASIAANAINAAAIAANAITNAKFAANAIDAAALATDAAQEIRDSVWTKTLTELTGDPTAAAAVLDAICLIFMSIRNKHETDSGGGTDKIFNNAGSAILSAALTDTGAGGVFTKGKYA